MDKTIEITDLTELNRIKNIRKQTIEASFAEIKSRQALKEPVNKELLLLHSILGDILTRAIEILDNSTVKFYTSVGTDRGIFEITGFHGPPYYIYPQVPNCQCEFHRKEVITNKKELFCKHFIAAELANSLKRYESVHITDKQEFSKFVATKLSNR